MTREDRRDELFNRWRVERDPAVRNEIVESYAPLAEYFANRYRNRGAEAEDLRQVAHLALVGAVERFDPDVGVKFSTFAGRTIDGELKRYFRDKMWAVRVPRSLKELSIEVRRAADRLSGELGRSPTVGQIAAETGLDTDVVIEALDVQATGFRAESLERPAGDGDARTLGDTLTTDDSGEALVDIRLAVRRLMEDLPDRERTILELRFFEELSQQEIADAIGVSQMHVSRLLRRTLGQLREQLRPV